MTLYGWIGELGGKSGNAAATCAYFVAKCCFIISYSADGKMSLYLVLFIRKVMEGRRILFLVAHKNSYR